MRTPLVHRITLLGLLVLAGCAAMHRRQVANMKANGDPRAPCYEACGPSDVVCMKECDNAHRSAARPVDDEAALRLLTAAAREDEARRKSAAARNVSANEVPSTPSGIAVSEKKASSPASFTECRPECEPPRKCTVYLKGTKQ